MELRIMELLPVRLACLRYTGPYGPALGEFWRDHFLPWCAHHQFDSLADCYGIGLDDPATTAPEDCRYDAGIEVPTQFQASAPAHIHTLPGGRYAVAQFCGNASQIGAAWQAMFQQLLPQQGLQIDARPCFERYLAGTRTDPETGLFSCDICVAVC